MKSCVFGGLRIFILNLGMCKEEQNTKGLLAVFLNRISAVISYAEKLVQSKSLETN